MNLENKTIAFVENNEAVTTSLAISAGTKNEHASVITLVRSHKADLEEFGVVDFKSTTNLGSGGRPTEFALLNEQQATLLITYMRNSDVVRAFKKALVKAFFELRKQAIATPAPARDPMEVLRDPAAMRGLLLGYTEKVLALEATITANAPKVAAHDRLATKTDGALCFREAAKSLQIPERVFMKWLRENRWIYRHAGSDTNLGYQERVQQGLIEHKITTIDREDGSKKVITQALITAKGLARLAEIHGAPLALGEAAK